MRILLDANMLLRSVQPNHPQHADAVSAVISLEAGGYHPVIVPQVLYEFWVVATRPVPQNGLGFSAVVAEQEIAQIRSFRDLLQDDESMFDAWLALVSKYAVLGKRAHDARLVAAMLRHGVTHLLTFNSKDFARFAEITVISPTSARSLPPATM